MDCLVAEAESIIFVIRLIFLMTYDTHVTRRKIVRRRIASTTNGRRRAWYIHNTLVGTHCDRCEHTRCPVHNIAIKATRYSRQSVSNRSSGRSKSKSGNLFVTQSGSASVYVYRFSRGCFPTFFFYYLFLFSANHLDLLTPISILEHRSATVRFVHRPREVETLKPPPRCHESITQSFAIRVNSGTASTRRSTTIPSTWKTNENGTTADSFDSKYRDFQTHIMLLPRSRYINIIVLRKFSF